MRVVKVIIGLALFVLFIVCLLMDCMDDVRRMRRSKARH